jgi:hypothetical protein
VFGVPIAIRIESGAACQQAMGRRVPGRIGEVLEYIGYFC